MKSVGQDVAGLMQQLVSSSLLVGLPVAALAGLVSFFSPCVVPLLPGYLSYTTGLSATSFASGAATASPQRGRLVAGASLFVLGFTVIFVLTGAVVGGIGRALLQWQELITQVLGVVVIAVGLVFTGWLGFAGGERRLRWTPKVGLASAPLLGAVFGLGWTPCIGPTLTVVLTMAYSSSSAAQGAALAAAYALGLGIPFVLAGAAYQRLSRTVGVLRRHQRAIQQIGGIIMILIGLAMVTGVWNWVIGHLRASILSFTAPI